MTRYLSPFKRFPRAFFFCSSFIIITIHSAIAQQTINYSDTQVDSNSIIITGPVNPTTLNIISGSATQSGTISDSGTSGAIFKTGSGTLTLTGSNTYHGETTVDFGTLAVSGTSAAISQSNIVTVGSTNGDNGALLISGGGNVSDAGGFIGDQNGSSGTVTVTGTGSSWNNSAFLNIGTAGAGALTISNGGQVTDGVGNIGSNTSTGTVTVTGSNSVWNNISNLTINSGLLTVANAAVVKVQNGTGQLLMEGLSGTINIGNGGTAGTVQAASIRGLSGNNVINFNETDSSYTFAANLAGNLNVNQTGTGTTILTGTNTYSGTTTISHGTLAVTGTASLGLPVASTSVINVGYNTGDNGTLLVSGGGQVTVNYVTVGSASNSSGSITVTGSGSYLSDATSLQMGSSGTAVLTISNGGIVQVGGGTGTLTLGGSSYFSSGTVNIGNGGLSGTLEAGTILGTSGSGSATINFSETDSSYTFAPSLTGNLSVNQIGIGMTVLTGSNSFIGTTTISKGTLAVSGIDASFNSGSSNNINVGYNSGDNGTLLISNGGQVFDYNGYVGYNSNSTGSVTVTGAGSYWNNTYLTVGYNGEGTMTISNGGQVADYFGEVGSDPGSTGTVTVAGIGSLWNNTYLDVGFYRTQGALIISNGAQVLDQYGSVGSYTSGEGMVTVTGSGSLWSNSSTLFVGVTGTATLTVANGGVVQVASGTGTLELAENLGSSGTLIIGNGGTAGTVQASMIVGGAGKGVVNFSESDSSYTFLPLLTGSLSVNQTSTGTITLVGSETYTGNTTVDFGTLQVSGTGTSLNSGSNSTVTVSRLSGDNGTLIISNGGQVSDEEGYIALTSTIGTSSNGNVVVTGIGSSWNNSDALTIGYGGTGTLTISAGAQVSSGEGYIGYGGGIPFGVGQATVTGTGSLWSSGIISVGYSGYDGGTLTISNGGEVLDAKGYIGNDDETMSFVTVTGSGSLWNNTTSLYIGEGGSYQGWGTLTIANGGAVEIANGTGTLVLAKSVSDWGVLNIGNGSLSGTLEASVVTGGQGSAVVNFDESDATYIFTPKLTGNLSVNQIGTGTTVITGADTYTGTTTVSLGTLAISGTGASINSGSSGTVYAGYNSGDNGTLLVSCGGQVTNPRGVIGFSSGSTGTATVIDPGSYWRNTTSLTVGNSGNGVLTVANGGTVQIANGTGTLTLAQNAGATGTLNIGNGGLSGTLQVNTVAVGLGTATVNFDESDSSYTFAPKLTGTLSVNQIGMGTTVLTGTETYTGNTTVNFGTLSLMGTGAKISSASSGIAYVGVNNDDKGTLNISSGAEVLDQAGYIGLNSGSTGSVTVLGTGSLWNNTTNLYVGSSGSGTLNVSNGGEIFDQTAFIGDLTNSAGNATISGSNSFWNNNNGFYVGTSGSGTFNISNGAQVSDVNGFVGYNSGGAGTVTMIGTGSLWSTSTSLVIGYSGSGSLTVADGAIARVESGIGTLILAQTADSVGILNIGDGGLAGTIQAATVTGGTGAAVVNFDESDSSYIFSPNLTGSLSVNQIGTGTTILTGTNTYTGGTTISAGSLLVKGSSVGNFSINAGGTLSGGGTINGKVTVTSGGSTWPGDPQILSVSSIEYQSGSTAQFSIATTSSSSHPPTPGVDYDQIKLTGGSSQVLQIDSGTTTLQLNLTTTSLAALQSNAANNINDLYFVYNLGSGTSSGQFTDLTLTVGSSIYTDAIVDGTATFAQLGLQFDLSYTASETNNSMTGGNDIALSIQEAQAVPEPSTWFLIGLGLTTLIFCQRGMKRQSRF